jgi:hypothetical protein
LDRNSLELCRIEGLTFQGRWSHAPLTSSTNPAAKGIHFFSVANYQKVALDGVRAFDCRGQFSRSFSCENFEYRNCHFERISSDCIRAGDCNNVLIDGNFVRDTGDNSIAAHTFVTHPGTVAGQPAYINRPPRSNLIITNNRLVNCVAPTILGAHTVVFSGNIMQRNHGSVSIGLQAPPAEGTNTQANITVTNNIIEDCLARYTGGGTFPAQTRAQGALMLGGAPMTKDSSAVFPGEYDPATHSVLGPWGDGSPDPPWGYLWTASSVPVTGALQHSSAGLHNLSVGNNKVVRTLPPVPSFSTWKQGRLFVSTGYEDPAVPDSAFRMSGIVLAADIRNFIVSDNIISGHRSGPGLMLQVTSIEELTDHPFRGGLIRGNLFHDLGMGITTHHAADIVSPDLNSDIVIEGNRFDIDPYHKSSFRTSPIDGTWPNSSASADFPTAINCQGYRGWTIRGNVISNVYTPIGPTLVVAYANAHLENNLLYCDPVAAGWNAANRGIANVPQASNAFRHMIIDGNSTAATWRAMKNTLPQSANTMPTSGTYLAGQVVYNLTPAVAAGKVLIGWARLTTGSAHVAGTDWSPLYCTVT